jgi:hypothetical protein
MKRWGSRSWTWRRYSEVSAPAPCQTKVVFKNHNRYWQIKQVNQVIFFQKNRKYLTFNLKAVQTGSYKADLGAGAKLFQSQSCSSNKQFRLHNTG